MKKPDKVLRVRVPADKFVRSWLEFLSPYHRLSAREKDVAARIIMQYIKLRDTVPDPVLVKEVLWSQSSRKDMRESLGMTQAHFQMVLAKMRNAGMLKDGEIDDRYIPPTTSDPRCILCVVFDWSTPSDPVRGEQQ